MSVSESVVVHAYGVVRVSPLTEYLNIVSDKLYSSSYTVCKAHQSSKIRLNLKTVHTSKKFEGWMNCSMYSYMGKCIVYLVCSIVASIMVASWGATEVNQESDERKTTEPSLQYNYTMRLISVAAARGGQGGQPTPWKLKRGQWPPKNTTATVTSYSLYVVYVHGSRLAAV